MTDWWIDDEPYAGPTEFELRHIIAKYSSVYRTDKFGETEFAFEDVVPALSSLPMPKWKPRDPVWAIYQDELHFVGHIENVRGNLIGRDDDKNPRFRWKIDTILTSAEQELMWNPRVSQPPPSTSQSYVSLGTRPNTSTGQKASGASLPILGQPFMVPLSPT